MAKKNIQVLTSSQRILNDSREYSTYVCSTRAIPSIHDGLKTGQRIALWLLRNRADKMKTFALSGQMGFERLYVHGEASANGAINLLAAPYKNNVPLIKGLGQFGSRVAPVEGIGAPRYTDVARSKAAEAFLYNDLDLVPLKDNYDGSNKEPVHFLPLIPLVLLNGVKGVAVGWATNILPRSLKTVIQATQDALMDRPVKTMKPHFDKYNLTIQEGKKDRQWMFSGKATVEDTSTVRITELPPSLDIADFRKRLIEMEDAESIVRYVDRSTDCIDITVKFKRGSIAGWTEQRAIDFFKLTETATENITVIGWSGQNILSYPSAEQIVVEFAKWRLGWYSTRFEKKISDTSYELNYWMVLEALFKGGFTSKLGTFGNRAEVEAEVTKVATKAKLTLDDAQMDRVVSLPTYRWTKEFEAKVKEKIAELKADLKEYNAILKSPERLKQVYYDELEALKKMKF